MGRHWMVELYGCEACLLNDISVVEDILVSAALAAGASVLNKVFYKFSPQGVSGVVVISESHLAIHTWPEWGYAACDVFTCGEHINSRAAVDCLVKSFKAQHYVVKEVLRGELKKILQRI